MQITSIVSVTMGLISGAVSTAVPMAYGISPLNSYATGAIAAIGVGITTYGLWHMHGKGYFAEYLAKQADAAIKAQKDSFQNAVLESLKNKLPTMVSSTSFIDAAVQSIENRGLCLDNYSTNPQIVRKVLDDIDNRIPYENNLSLKSFSIKQPIPSLMLNFLVLMCPSNLF